MRGEYVNIYESMNGDIIELKTVAHISKKSKWVRYTKERLKLHLKLNYPSSRVLSYSTTTTSNPQEIIIRLLAELFPEKQTTLSSFLNSAQ